MEYLALEVFDRDGKNPQFAYLPEDANITITDTSEIFDSGDVWTYSFQLNVLANAHIFGTAGDMHGSRLHEQVDKRRARLWVDGTPMYLGYLRVDETVDVDEKGNVNVSFESGQKTFKDMVDGVKANQVPLMSDVLIGMALDRERTMKRKNVKLYFTQKEYNFQKDNLYYMLRPSNVGYSSVTLEGIKDLAQWWPKYVRPDGTWTSKSNSEELTIPKYSTVNTDMPYDDAHPYCNTRVCYQQRKLKRNANGEIEKENVRGYTVTEPRRINPSPNFYVIYWIRSVMKHLGIFIEENRMMDVDDLRRLFLVNTKCGYKTNDDERYESDYIPSDPYTPFVPPDKEDDPAWKVDVEFVGGEQSAVDMLSLYVKDTGQNDTEGPTWRKAYATCENFPDVDLYDVINAVETGFGVRFFFNREFTKVRIVVLRDLLRSKDVIDLRGDVIQVYKQENCIRGFRLTYGGSEENTSYVYKLFTKKKTGGWIDMSDNHDYSFFNQTLHYASITEQVDALNKTCYYDDITGNAYIVKIDENAKNPDEWFPSLFECAQFMDAEDGDCTGDAETIKEIQVGFTPETVNAIKERRGRSSSYALFLSDEMEVSNPDYDVDTPPSEIPITKAENITVNDNKCSIAKSEVNVQSGLMEIATSTPFKAKSEFAEDGEIFNANCSLFYREALWPMFPWHYIRTTNVRFKISGWIRDGYRLYLQDNYKISDDLTSPLETHDWGLMFGVMRGSGDGTIGPKIDYSPDTKDGEGNDSWELTPGAKAAAHSDTCDDYGNTWNYSPSVEYTGLEYGDKLLTDAGCQNQCDLKNRMGPSPLGLDIYGIIDTYYSGTGSALIIITDSGYYACDGVVSDIGRVDHKIRLCCVKSDGTLQVHHAILAYFSYLQNGSSGDTSPTNLDEILSRDRTGATVSYGTGQSVFLQNMIIAADFTDPDNIQVLTSACSAFLLGEETMSYVKPEGEISQDSRFSLKLRAEKPNPYFDPTQPESAENRRYLEITTPGLRRRGLADRFYKEYSYWVRNARIAKVTARIGLAELMAIDKTKRVRIGDITGFIKKMQYSVSQKTGLGNVSMEIWYL